MADRVRKLLKPPSVDVASEGAEELHLTSYIACFYSQRNKTTGMRCTC